MVRLRNGRTVSDVEAEVCPRCGERYYDLEAMRKIERARAGAVKTKQPG
jgi:Zn-finger nucleic acid-binding protein